jgi:two-component system, OmpR family, sensor kinase
MTPTPFALGQADPQVGSSEDTLERIAVLSEAIAARDTFIAVAAHELRNPMMPILGQIDLLISAVRAERCSLEQVEDRPDART